MRRGAWDNSAARQRGINAGGSSVSSVYLTISPEAGGCSALLLLIGTSCPTLPCVHPAAFACGEGAARKTADMAAPCTPAHCIRARVWLADMCTALLTSALQLMAGRCPPLWLTGMRTRQGGAVGCTR